MVQLLLHLLSSLNLTPAMAAKLMDCGLLVELVDGGRGADWCVNWQLTTSLEHHVHVVDVYSVLHCREAVCQALSTTHR